MALDYTAMMQTGYGVPNYSSIFAASPETLVPTTALPYDQQISLGPEVGEGLTALKGLADILKQAEAPAQSAQQIPNAGLMKLKGVDAGATPKAAPAFDPTIYKALAALLQGGFK